MKVVIILHVGMAFGPLGRNAMMAIQLQEMVALIAR